MCTSSRHGELLLKSFHAEHAKDTAGWNGEFARGELMGWRSTLHTLEIVQSMSTSCARSRAPEWQSHPNVRKKAASL